MRGFAPGEYVMVRLHLSERLCARVKRKNGIRGVVVERNHSFARFGLALADYQENRRRSAGTLGSLEGEAEESGLVERCSFTRQARPRQMSQGGLSFSKAPNTTSLILKLLYAKWALH